MNTVGKKRRWTTTIEDSLAASSSQPQDSDDDVYSFVASPAPELEESDDNLSALDDEEEQEISDEESHSDESESEREDEANDSQARRLTEKWYTRLETTQPRRNTCKVKNDCLSLADQEYTGYLGTERIQKEFKWKLTEPTKEKQEKYNSRMSTDYKAKPNLSEAAEVLRGKKKPVDFLRKVITPEIINKILTHTNAYMEAVCAKKLKLYHDGERRAKPRQWEPLDEIELWAYFGALYYIGAKQQGGRSVNDLFARDGYEIHLPLSEAFSRDRFHAIKHFFRFYDEVNKNRLTLVARRSQVKQLLIPIIDNCRALITPAECLVVEEHSLNFRGQLLPWRQKLPEKYDTLDIKVFGIFDAVTGAIVGGIPYFGRQKSKCMHPVRATRIVLKLVTNFVYSGRTIVTDPLFTSPLLAIALWGRGLRTVGNLNPAQKGLPADFIKLHLRNKKQNMQEVSRDKAIDNVVDLVSSTRYCPDGERGDPKNGFLFHKQLTLVKLKARQQKQVHFLSTKHHSSSVAASGAKEAEAVEYYRNQKLGLDLLDELVKDCSTKWTNCSQRMRVLFWVLDMAAVQSFIVYCLANKDEIDKDVNFRRNFMDRLWQDLMAPHIRRRSAALQNSGHAKKFGRVRDALQGLQRKSVSVDLLPNVNVIPKPSTSLQRQKPAAVRHQQYFEQSPKPKRKRGVCFCGSTRRSSLKCELCKQWVCEQHRRTVLQGGKKHYYCLEGAGSTCNGYAL